MWIIDYRWSYGVDYLKEKSRMKMFENEKKSERFFEIVMKIDETKTSICYKKKGRTFNIIAVAKWNIFQSECK